MSHYIHHIPGRLRVKSVSLRRNERGAAQVREHLEGLHGITFTEVNTVTGSVLIKYDPRLVEAQTLLNSLRGQGHIHSHPPLRSEIQVGQVDLGQKISDTVVNKLVETVVERSAAALIAAIL
jgi:hypothetical protein